MSTGPKPPLRVAFCLCNGVTLSDFITPSEILGSLGRSLFGTPTPYDGVSFDFLAPQKGPVSALIPEINPQVIANKSYEEASKEEYDVLWVPAGPIPNPTTGEDPTPLEEIEFIKAQAPKTKYVASVCGGSMILARAGVLNGKRATTNKMLYRVVEKQTEGLNVNWVPEARWVVDGNVWTSSGVTAGADMALAFAEHLSTKEYAEGIRGILEVRHTQMDEDPFAKVHGLV
ncbi:class I glutamine amidotransferase-like protein [Atractiella rhizophila]|nr:class I glutamine amidotransferase-like protein [Atractiella rhizophila]